MTITETVSNERLAEHLSVGGWDSKMSLTPSETNSALLELQSLRNAQSEAVAVSDLLHNLGLVGEALANNPEHNAPPQFAHTISQAMAALSRPSSQSTVQCCTCGKKGLSTVEGDGGTECELADGRWTCSQDCYYTAVDWYSALTHPAPPLAVADERIERMARALHDEWNGVGAWSSLTDRDRRRWEFMARTALTAALEAKQ